MWKRFVETVASLLERMAVAIQKEPVVTFQAIAAFVEILIAAIVVFGFDVTPAQTAGILTTIVGSGQLLAALLGRTYVTPTANPRADDGRKLKPW